MALFVTGLWLLFICTLHAQPGIAVQPQPQNVSIGTSPILQLVATNAGPPIRYQWRLNGANLPNQTNTQLQLTNIQPTNAGTYSGIAYDVNGTTNSQLAPVQVTNIPVLPFSNTFALRGFVVGTNGVGRSDNSNATVEAGEPAHGGVPGGASVWLKWTPAASGIATFATRGSGFDTTLGIYTGTVVTNLTPVFNGASDDEAGFYTSTVTFNAQGNQEYQIAVDGYYGAKGNIVLRWNQIENPTETVPEIAAQPQDKTIAPGGTAVFTVTANPGSPVVYQWYFNDSPVAGATSASFAVSNATVAKLGQYRCRVTDAGTGRTTASTAATLQFNQQDAGVNTAVIAHDKFRSATDASAGTAGGFTGTQMFSTYGMARELGEPNHAGKPGGASAWFVYKPPGNGPVTIDTAGTVFDNVLAVYTLAGGAGFTNLALVAASGTNNGPGPESVTFTPLAGTTYFIAVDGVGGATGPAVINWSQAAPPLPFGDKFVNRGPIGGTNGAGSGSNVGANKEVGEPNHGHKPGGASVWLKWTPSVSGIATFTLHGSDFDTTLSIYEGTSVDSLTPVLNGFNDDEDDILPPIPLTSKVTFNAVANHEYQIAVDGFYGATGNILLSWFLAAGSARAPEFQVHPVSHTIAPGSDTSFSVTVDPSSLPVNYQWYLNDTPISGATDFSVTINNANITDVGSYRVRITDTQTFRSSASTIALLQLNSTDATGANPNDQAQNKFRESTDPGAGPGLRGGGNAAPAGGYTGTQVFSTYAAGREPGEPNHCGNTVGSSYWYFYTPPASGLLTVDTAGTSYNNVLAVYTGPGDSYTSLVAVTCSSTNLGAGKEASSFSVALSSNYFVVVDGVNGAFGSAVINYSLATPPVITTNPQSRTVTEGSNVTLTAAATGLPTPDLRWRFQSATIPGATNGSLTRTNFSYTQEGAYDLVATNVAGTALSATAYLYLTNWRLLQLSNPAPSNWFSALIASPGSSNYVIQGTTNFSNWVNLRTNNVASGITNFVDTNTSSFGKRFYRLVN
ncbi:MAG: immunoglobulin domain-containing protein [Verrucomicrobia bacterium]|nr:immunoglobulin domain-containing protein [Verrucomicrobiota bacterium]